MKRLAALLLLSCVPMLAQTTVFTMTNTVKQANAQKEGIDLSVLSDFGTGGNLYKDPFYADGGTLPSYYNQTSWKAQGTGMTTTSWPTGFPQASGGYLASFFNGATYEAHDGITGAILGTGTITASSASTSSVGPTFTLSAALSRVPVSNQDVLFVRLTASSSAYMTPLQLFARTGVGLSGTCAGGSGLTFDSTDLDPNSNGLQSLVMPSGCTIQYNADQSMRNSTNPNPTVAAVQMNNRVINGQYKEFFGYKCSAGSGSGLLSVQVNRSGGQTFVASHNLTPVCNSSPTAGWAVDAPAAVTGTETIPPLGNLIFSVTCTTGPCKVSYHQFVEQTGIGNNTVYTDAVVSELMKYKPGTIRLMDPSLWCSTLADEMAEGGSHSFPEGTQRWCNVSNYLPYQMDSPQSYPDVLALAAFIGSDVVFTTSYFNTAGQYTAFTPQLAANASYIALATAGHHASPEIGNEAFNSLAGGFYGESDGEPYGALLSSLVLGFKAGSGYDAAHMPTIGNGWFTSGQTGKFGWPDNVCKAIAANGGGYPRYLNAAPYNFKTLATYTLTAGNLDPSGDNWLGMGAEVDNFNAATPPSGTPSMQQAVTFLHANCGPANSVDYALYEKGSGNVVSVNGTQPIIDQSATGVGQAVVQIDLDDQMLDISGVTGYLGQFALTEVFNGNTCSGTCAANIVTPVWGIEGPGGLGCGPGNLNCNGGTERPSFISLAMHNTALSTLSSVNLMSSSTTGAPTYSYAGGQAGTIGANSAVAYVRCTQFGDGGSNSIAECRNKDPLNPHPVQLSGLSPVGSITQYQFGAANNIYDHNEGTYLGPSSISPIVTGWTTTSVSGTTFTLPAHSVTLFKMITSGTPQAATPAFAPAPGTYTSAQTVTVTDSTAGASIFCTTDGSTPTPSSTPYAGPFSVPSTQTIKCMATAAGFSNSAVGGGLYTIASVPTLAAPTFTPAGGTYSGTQSVMIAPPSGATACYTVNTTPTLPVTAGTCPAGTTTVSGPVSVAVSETLNAYSTQVGFSTSTISTAVYSIGLPTAVAPVFLPTPGPQAGPVTVTMSSTTLAAQIYFTQDGTTPTFPVSGTTQIYAGGIIITATTNFKAIAAASGFNNSPVTSADYTLPSTASITITIKGSTVTFQGIGSTH